MDTRTSPFVRASLSRLAATPHDLLVIGGGITGAGIARDAAMRGLTTVLVDAGDLAAGTSSRSSRLIHGGLRYLEQGRLRLVHEASRERRVLLRIAPHLVRPMPFVFPVHRGDRVPLWKLAAGLWLYDLLAAFRNVRHHRILGKRALLREEPMLRERGLIGGARYFDAQCDDARLTLATARAAMVSGAAVATYMPVRALELAGGEVRGAEVEDLLTGERGSIRASVVVNATGPWADDLRRLEDPAAPPLLRRTAGAHALVPRYRLGHRAAITMTSPIDGRVMFVLPWGDFSYIGTTETEMSGPPEAAAASQADVLYLLRSANACFPHAHLTEDDVVATWAGVRALVAENGGGPASSVTREHLIDRGPAGMFTIAGGKLTTYRAMASEMVDLVEAELARRERRPRAPAPPTDSVPLPGGEAGDLSPLRQAALDLGLTVETADHLLRHYGTETAAICNLVSSDRSLLAPLDAAHPAIEAEVVHHVRRELAVRVEDVMLRRIHLGYEAPDCGAAAVERVAALMGRELGWDAGRREEEVARWRNRGDVRTSGRSSSRPATAGAPLPPAPPA
jgi:glycerol-3-phosphate dehydrogenase